MLVVYRWTDTCTYLRRTALVQPVDVSKTKRCAVDSHSNRGDDQDTEQNSRVTHALVVVAKPQRRGILMLADRQ